MSGTNTRAESDFAAALTEPIGGTAYAIAADTIDDTDWLLVLALTVGSGSTDLVGHAVLRMPDFWRSDAEGRGDWLHDLGRFMATPTPDRLTTAIVRTATTTRLEQRARAAIAEVAGYGWDVASGPGPKPRGPRAQGDLRRAEVARRYVELHRTSATPKADLAREMHLAVNSVNSLLYQARDRGLLTSAGRGRAGGALTPLALELLGAAPTESKKRTTKKGGTK